MRPPEHRCYVFISDMYIIVEVTLLVIYLYFYYYCCCCYYFINIIIIIIIIIIITIEYLACARHSVSAHSPFFLLHTVSAHPTHWQTQLPIQ